MKRVILFTTVALVFWTGCTIQGSFQGLYSYYSRTKSKDPDLLIKPDAATSICEINKSDSPRVYVINGINLKNCVKNQDKALIYIWAPKCKGKFCYSLNSLQSKCNLKDISLFIVAEYYDSELMQRNYQTQKPIFGIAVDYYNSNRTSRYLSKFIYDLTNEKDLIGRFIYFENGLFKKSFEAIEEI